MISFVPPMGDGLDVTNLRLCFVSMICFGCWLRRRKLPTGLLFLTETCLELTTCKEALLLRRY